MTSTRPCEETGPVVFLLGPTASGKTAVGVVLCKAIDCQLISVDSSLVYRGMDIGTAKPSAEEQRQAPHKLIDLCDPWDIYSAARFCTDARREIASAKARGKLPVLIGGTMLYYNALENGLAEMPEADQPTRDALSARACKQGWKSLHTELAQIDPIAAARIHPNDPQRIQRALEVWQLSGKTLTQWQLDHKRVSNTMHDVGPNKRADIGKLVGPIIKCALFPGNRGTLHQRIEARFDAMLACGFLDEVRGLRQDLRLSSSLPSMRSVGYRQAWQHLDGESTEVEFRERSLAATRQLAKRQMTWMRSMVSLQKIDSLVQPPLAIVGYIERAIAYYNARLR